MQVRRDATFLVDLSQAGVVAEEEEEEFPLLMAFTTRSLLSRRFKLMGLTVLLPIGGLGVNWAKS